MPWSTVDHVEASFADGNTGHVVSLPLGGTANAGDIDAIIIGSDTTVTTPTGFTLPTGGSFVGNQGGYAVYRQCAGGESASVTITTSGNFNTSVGWTRKRGAAAVSPFDGADNAHIDANGNTTNPAVSTGTLSAAGEWLFVGSVMTDAAAGNATAPSWTNATAVGSTSIGSGASASVGFYAENTNAGTASVSPSVTWTNSMRNRYIFILAFKAASGLTASIGIATETDTTGAVSMRLGLNVATETDAAVTITRRKTRTVGVAAETDGVGAVSMRLGLNPATETDAAQPVTRRKARVLGVASTTDTAGTLARAKAKAVGAAVEADSAVAVTRVHARALGVATEVDLARPVSHGTRAAVGTAAEADTAGTLTGRHVRAAGTATETDSAVTFAPVRTRTIAAAAETDSAVTLALALGLAVAVETDAALVVTTAGGAPLGGVAPAITHVAGPQRVTNVAGWANAATAVAGPQRATVVSAAAHA